MSRKSERKAEHKILARALQSDEFPWDYSYTPGTYGRAMCGGNSRP